MRIYCANLQDCHKVFDYEQKDIKTDADGMYLVCPHCGWSSYALRINPDGRYGFVHGKPPKDQDDNPSE